MTRWGIVSTIKASAGEILNFVAYHLELGAGRVFIYLDNQNPKAEAALRTHPKVTVVQTNDAHWAALGKNRPAKHQPRQTQNASHAYRMADDIDWLCHIDVDEFLCPNAPVAQLLGALPRDVPCGRVRPAEALATEGIDGLDPAATYCKAWMPGGSSRMALEQELYPNFGGYMRGGFVSHFVGKIFIRTGLGDLDFRIHRAMQNKQEIGPSVVMEGVELCHRHIVSWDKWQKIFDYRMTKGSYRSELKPTRKAELGGLSLHDLFTFLLDDGGETALRAFYEEVCLARPELIQKLEANGLLRVYHLNLLSKRRKHFPQFQ